MVHVNAMKFIFCHVNCKICWNLINIAFNRSMIDTTIYHKNNMIIRNIKKSIMTISITTLIVYHNDKNNE